jgi:hypothetical protein
MKNTVSSPVIIVGMHRSGTSMLTEFLNSYNIFMGNDVEDNGESISFLKINEKILRVCRSSWYDLNNFDFYYKRKKDYIEKLYYNLLDNMNHKNNFWGKNNIYNFVGDYKWGWKDPRNTLIIETLRKVFYNAKFIHIYRNPIDVANSLKNREQLFNQNGRLKWYYNIIKNYINNGIYVDRCPSLVDLKKGINLWFQYVSRAISYKDNFFHICYEKFLENPTFTFNSLCNFLGTEFKNSFVENLIKTINSNRRYSFIKDKTLISHYRSIQNKPLLKRLLYDKIV